MGNMSGVNKNLQDDLGLVKWFGEEDSRKWGFALDWMLSSRGVNSMISILPNLV